MATVKQIIDEFCYRGNFPSFSTYVTSTNPQQQQYVSLLKYIGDLLVNRPQDWPQLKRTILYPTRYNQRNYPIPGDWYRNLESTPWDSTNQWPMRGPISDYNYAIRSQAIVSLQTRKGFRFIGNTNTIFHNRYLNEYSGVPYQSDGYMEIDPAGSNETDVLSYSYVSRNWAIPPAWRNGTAYALNDKVSVNGLTYIAAVGGTSAASPAIPPTVNNGIGSDGNCWWSYVVTSAFAGTTSYSLGEVVVTGGNYYMVTVGGTSSGSAPVHTSGSEVNGTVTFTYITAPAWAAETTYASSAYVVSGGNLYLNVSLVSDGSLSTSGKTAPNWTYDTASLTWKQVDGTVTWQQQQALFTIGTDSDLVLFDKDLIINGMNWAYKQAKGLEFMDLRSDWEQMVAGAFGRWNGPQRINAADEFGDQFGDWPNTPNGDWDVGSMS